MSLFSLRGGGVILSAISQAIKGETDVYKVSKIYTDNYDNKKHIYLKSTVRELGLNLIDDRNLVKLTDKDKDNTQLRMSSMLMIFMLK